MFKNTFLLIISAFLISSCSNDFEIASDWKDIPVVYAMYDPTEENHYFRVQKAYLDGKGNALTLAQIPDSIYYEGDFKVVLEKGNGTEFIMDRVNAADVGLVKDEGVFASSPLYLYTIDSTTFKTETNENIKLKLIHNGVEIGSSSADVLNTFQLRTSVTTLNFGANKQPIKWETEVMDETVNFDISLIFNYTESINGSEEVMKSLSWPMLNNIPASTTSLRYSEEVTSDDFYSFLMDKIVADPTAVRTFSDVAIKIYAGGLGLSEYQDAQNVSGGITSAQFVPVYSNIENGRGVFSSRSNTVSPIPFHPRSLDSLRDGRFTKDLNF